MTTEDVDAKDVIWPSDLAVVDVENHPRGLRLIIEGFSPDDGEFAGDRDGRIFLLPYRLHFTNGRTVRIPDAEMELMQTQGFPDMWHGRVATVFVAEPDRFSGPPDGNYRIAEQLRVFLEPR